MSLIRICVKPSMLGLSIFVLIATAILLGFTHNFIRDSLKPEWYLRKLSQTIGKTVDSPTRLCSCATCISEHAPSPWYDERFNDTIPLLLTKDNSQLPEDVYKWWMKLQRDRKPAAFNETVKTLFETIPGESDFLGNSPSRCRRCAVVGNSGNLKNSGYGEQIDSHDVIMRMNLAPTIGFEADVGSRTTHHFIYPASAWNLYENATLVVVPFKTLDLLWIISALTTGNIGFVNTKVPRRINARRDKILIYNPIFMKYVYGNWMEKHGWYPSTGMLCIIFSLHVCDQVDIYGFGIDNNGQLHHYWDKKATATSGVQNHDWTFQGNLTETLHSINKIRIFKGS